MAAYNKFEAFVAAVHNKKHDFSADTFKFALTNVAPIAGNSVLADITEISAGNGYTAGGSQVTISTSTQTGGVYSAVPTGDVVLTAAGGAIAQFRYVVLYNDTTAANDLISWYDRGSAVELLDGETFTIQVGATLFTSS